MKHLLVGNGVNIQFDKINYTTKQIVLRILENCDRDDFPSHIIVNFPYLLKNYLGLLFLEARNIINGEYDQYVSCNAEKASLAAFKEQYARILKTLRMTDIGFEDYYLIHDLVCHKTKTVNPERFYIREALRIAYLFAIYNDGAVNHLHSLYPPAFIDYLKSFNSIFTTNYDSNIDSVTSNKVYHIHGQFDKLAAVYDTESFRNQLPDAPIKKTHIDPKYSYLYSNALSTHCGEYKEFQLKQYSLANDAVEKLASAYLQNPRVKHDVDDWTQSENTITANMGHAVLLKVKYPNLEFSDDYHFCELSSMKGSLDILGLSPWNDYHVFDAINRADIGLCTYYYHSNDQCERISRLLPSMTKNGVLKFSPVDLFWRQMYEG